MKRKNYWFMFAILLLSLTSLSPSFDLSKNIGSDPPGNDPIPPKTPDQPESDLGPIRIGVQLDDAEFQRLLEMNEEIVLDTGAKVDVVQLGTAASDMESLIQEMGLGDGPDVLLIDSHWIKPLALEGQLLPIEASQAVTPDSQLPGGLLEPMQWNGYQWGIPFDIDPYVLAWKPGDTEGDLPATRKGWQDFKKKRGPKAVFTLDPEDPYAFAAAIYALGGDPEKPDQQVLRLLAQQQVSSWLELQAFPMKQADNNDATSTVIIGPLSSAYGDLPDGYRLKILADHVSTYKPVVKSRCYAITAESSRSGTTALAMDWITEITALSREKQWAEKTGRLAALPVVYNASNSAVISSVEMEAVERLRVLLGQRAAAELRFGQENGFVKYKQSASEFLRAVITAEEFRKPYARTEK